MATATIFEKHSPWGPIEHETLYSDECRFVSTASHGGFQVTGQARKRVQALHPTWSPFNGTYGWYEEDCDAAIVVVALPELFPFSDVQRAATSILSYGLRYYSQETVAAAAAARVE